MTTLASSAVPPHLLSIYSPASSITTTNPSSRQTAAAELQRSLDAILQRITANSCNRVDASALSNHEHFWSSKHTIASAAARRTADRIFGPEVTKATIADNLTRRSLLQARIAARSQFLSAMKASLGTASENVPSLSSFVWNTHKANLIDEAALGTIAFTLAQTGAPTGRSERVLSDEFVQRSDETGATARKRHNDTLRTARSELGQCRATMKMMWMAARGADPDDCTVTSSIRAMRAEARRSHPTTTLADKENLLKARDELKAKIKSIESTRVDAWAAIAKLRGRKPIHHHELTDEIEARSALNDDDWRREFIYTLYNDPDVVVAKADRLANSRALSSLRKTRLTAIRQANDALSHSPCASRVSRPRTGATSLRTARTRTATASSPCASRLSSQATGSSISNPNIVVLESNPNYTLTGPPGAKPCFSNSTFMNGQDATQGKCSVVFHRRQPNRRGRQRARSSVIRSRRWQ